MASLWKPVAGTSGMYWVSSDGRLKSYRWWRRRGVEAKGKAFILSPIVQPDGHVFARMYIDDKTKTISMAKLMLLTFVGPPKGRRRWACHNDGDPSRNLLSNLRWGTNSENQMDRVAHGTSNRGSANGKAKLEEADVIRVHQLIAEKTTQRVIAAMYGVDQSAISNIARGRNWPQLHPTFGASV